MSDFKVGETFKDTPNPHYQGNETMDYIESQGMCFAAGNCVKYVSRYKKKGGKEDLLKARYYLDRLIDNYEEEEV